MTNPEGSLTVAAVRSCDLKGFRLEATTFDMAAAWSTLAYGVNNFGDIVGCYNTTSPGTKGFVEINGDFKTISVPESSNTNALGINDAGQIVGTYIDKYANHNGFIYNKGKYTTVNYPGSTYTTLTDINNRGQIVGFSSSASFIYDKGAFSNIAVPGAIGTIAVGINDYGAVSGYYNSSDGHQHGFIEKNGVYSTIDVPGSLYTSVGGINNFGEVTGSFAYANDPTFASHGFIDIGGVITTFNVPGSRSTSFNSPGINDFGQITSSSIDTANNEHGFIATLTFLKPTSSGSIPSAELSLPTHHASHFGTTTDTLDILGLNVTSVSYKGNAHDGTLTLKNDTNAIGRIHLEGDYRKTVFSVTQHDTDSIITLGS